MPWERSRQVRKEAERVGRAKRQEIATTNVEDPFEDNDFVADAASVDGSARNRAVVTPLCSCGKRAALRTTRKENHNHGRPFWCCNAAACSFFQWASSYPASRKAKRLRWLRHAPPVWSVCSSRWVVSARKIEQGSLGDCWFLAALRVITEREDIVTMLIGEPEQALSLHEQRGALVSCFHNDGHWHAVPVDCNLPIDPGHSPTTSKSPRIKQQSMGLPKQAFARPGSVSQCWCALVEKAYAKLYGSFRATVGGQVAEALLDLTGCPTETIMLQGHGVDHELIWRRIKQLVDLSLPIGCAAAHNGEGVVGGHAYSVLNAKELEDVKLGEQLRLDQQTQSTQASQSSCSNSCVVTGERRRTLRVVQCRNPWGVKEFNGMLGRKSEAWTKKLEAELGRTQRNDGVFWMPFQDFVKRFVAADAVHAFTNWHAATIPLLRMQSSCLVADDTSSAMVMSLRHSKRNRPSALFWYPDISVVLCKSGRPFKLLLSNSERERSLTYDLHLESGTEYTIVPFSIMVEQGDASECCVDADADRQQKKRKRNDDNGGGELSSEAEGFLRVFCESPFSLSADEASRARVLNHPPSEQLLALGLTRSPSLLAISPCNTLSSVKELALLSRKHMTALCLLRVFGYVLLIAVNCSKEASSVQLSCVCKRMRAVHAKDQKSGSFRMPARSQRVLLLAPATASEHALHLAFALEGEPLEALSLPNVSESSSHREQREAREWAYPEQATGRMERVMEPQGIDLVGETVAQEALAGCSERPSGAFEPFYPDPIAIALAQQ